MLSKRKDGRYQSSVILENPITGEKVRRYFYAYTLQELEDERRRIMNANISDFLLVETFHRFADEFLSMKRDVDKLEASTLSTYQGFLTRHILPRIPPAMKIADVKPALLKHILAQIDGDRTRQAVYTLLQSIFRAAKFERLIENNPMEYIRKPKHKATAAGIVTPEIYHAILDAIRGSQAEHLFNLFADLKRRLNLPADLRFHSFRHTHATLLAEQEISAKKIQVRLGHSSAAFTMDRYVHNTVQMQDGITEKIVKCEEKYSP